MLVLQLGLVALFAFEPLVSARFLARRLPEHSARATEGSVENVVRRDYNDELTLAELSTDGGNNDLEDDPKDGIQDHVPETISDNTLPSSSSNKPTSDYLSDGAEANPLTNLVGIDADSGAIADGMLPDDQTIYPHVSTDILRIRNTVHYCGSGPPGISFIIYSISGDGRDIVIDSQSNDPTAETFFHALDDAKIGYAIHALPNHGTLFVEFHWSFAQNPGNIKAAERVTSFSPDFRKQLGGITHAAIIDNKNDSEYFMKQWDHSLQDSGICSI